MYLPLNAMMVLLIGAHCYQEVAEDTLVLVHAVIRHGARTPDPILSYPNDIYKNLSFYPYGNGELNEEGIKNSYRLGKELRERYGNFLGPEYYPEMLEAMSSGFPRCRMTLQVILAGMFPPHPSQIIQEGLPWQPILYKYTEKNTDSMISFVSCLNFITALEIREEISECSDRNFLNEYLSDHAGMKIGSMMSVFYIYDTLKVEVENGLSVPPWAEQIWPDPLFTCTYDLWRHITSNKTVLGTMGGELMKKILNDTIFNIEDQSNEERKKVFLYTGHEHNIYICLGMMNGYNNTVVNYHAYILFEVHKINEVFGYKVFWDNRDEIGLRQLEIPECGMFCPVDKFNKLMEVYLNFKSCS